jgi:hypothetical protein
MVAGVRPRSRSSIASGPYRTPSVEHVVMQRRIVGEHEHAARRPLAAGQVRNMIADATSACHASPPAPVKAVAALASTFGVPPPVAVTGPALPCFPSASVAASVQKLRGIRVQFRHIPLLPRVILP